MAWGAIAGGVLGYLGAQDQADAAREGTGAAIGLQRDQFEYAKQLQEALLRQQEPRRQSSQNAMRSLSMMMGLGDPGGSAPIYQQQELTRLQDQLSGMDKFQTTSEPSYVNGERRSIIELGNTGKMVNRSAAPEITTDEINPEYADLESEISALEEEIGSYGGTDDFEGPTSVTEMPGYQFFKDEGLDALASSGAARGMQLSGRQMESAQKFGQGLASQFRGQLIDELGSMAGLRPSTAPVTNLSNLAVGQAGAISPLLQQQGVIGAAEKAGTYGSLGAMLEQVPWGQGNNMSFPQHNQTTGGPLFTTGGF